MDGIDAGIGDIAVRSFALARNPELHTTHLTETDGQVRGLADDRGIGLGTVVGNMLREKGLGLAVMESCTGGLLAATITGVAGASAYFRGGLIAYSGKAKVEFGVAPRIISEHGAVSAEAARAMAEAARLRLGADIGIGITGVAGPGGLEGKAAGLVHIAISDGETTQMIEADYPGTRIQVRLRATVATLFGLKKTLASLG